MSTVATRDISILLGTFLLQPFLSFACSAVGCLGNGTELSKNFAVIIVFGEQPISGATVEIHGNGRGFSQETDNDGIARIRNLKPGLYWIKAEVLGTEVAYQCFHVEATASPMAHRKLQFDWGSDAPAVSAIAGKMIDMQPGKTGKPLLDLLHPIEVGIAGAHLTLRDPINHTSYAAVSDDRGLFSFDQVPEGTYVLHATGGRAGDRAYDETDLIVALSASARRGSLLLTRREVAGGSCGGTSLEIRDIP